MIGSGSISASVCNSTPPFATGSEHLTSHVKRGNKTSSPLNGVVNSEAAHICQASSKSTQRPSSRRPSSASTADASCIPAHIPRFLVDKLVKPERAAFRGPGVEKGIYDPNRRRNYVPDNNDKRYGIKTWKNVQQKQRKRCNEHDQEQVGIGSQDMRTRNAIQGNELRKHIKIAGQSDHSNIAFNDDDSLNQESFGDIGDSNEHPTNRLNAFGGDDDYQIDHAHAHHGGHHNETVTEDADLQVIADKLKSQLKRVEMLQQRKMQQKSQSGSRFHSQPTAHEHSLSTSDLHPHLQPHSRSPDSVKSATQRMKQAQQTEKQAIERHYSNQVRNNNPVKILFRYFQNPLRIFFVHFFLHFNLH
jgi:hypothetical protein